MKFYALSAPWPSGHQLQAAIFPDRWSHFYLKTGSLIEENKAQGCCFTVFLFAV